MGKPHQFRQSDITRSIRALHAAGLEVNELRFDHLNRPVFRVGTSGPAGGDDEAAMIADWMKRDAKED